MLADSFRRGNAEPTHGFVFVGAKHLVGLSQGEESVLKRIVTSQSQPYAYTLFSTAGSRISCGYPASFGFSMELDAGKYEGLGFWREKTTIGRGSNVGAEATAISH